MFALSEKSLGSCATNKTFFITLPQDDGTSQYIPLSVEQAKNLGLTIEQTDQAATKAEEVIEQVRSDEDVEDTEPSQSETSNVIYKIVKPEDLNLIPTTTTYLPRGRPCKKLGKKGKAKEELTIPNNVEVKKIIKQVRTRSGRITKPPKYIEKDFEKIDITDGDKNDTELKTIEFEPLKTNEEPRKNEPLLSLQQHGKKRNIPSRFRCPTCNKAYLGKVKMMTHFEKHPDHGSVPITYRNKHTATWDFLIMSAQKCRGPKIMKFCDELLGLLQNARTMAKLLFKPVRNCEMGHYISADLALIFGIKEGSYVVDETELFKDITFYEYLESNSDNINDNVKNPEILDISNVKSTDEVTKPTNALDYVMKDTSIILEDKETLYDKCSEAKTNVNDPQTINFSSCVSNVNKEQSQISTSNDNSLALVKYELPKLAFNFISPYTNINNDLIIDSNISYQNINGKYEMTHKQNTTESSKQNEKKEVFDLQKHITLQNELHDVDELMLGNVDTGQVSNILETSSNSDDIMNVDQFVNERFKKLTEPDIDMHTNSLNLELPPLDIFQFHTS